MVPWLFILQWAIQALFATSFFCWPMKIVHDMNHPDSFDTDKIMARPAMTLLPSRR
jgi:hypothetical protein